jgi:tRNA A37 threonylcarbamoyltransferase TsaD
MADPTLVDGQITDAVTQANVKVLGDAPAMAMGTVFQTTAQSIGLSMQNAVAAQQMMNRLTVAIAARVVGENTDASDSGLWAALDVLRRQDPVAQMKPLAELVRQIQETIAPLAKAAP